MERKINESLVLLKDPYKLIMGLNDLSVAMNSNYTGTTDEVSKLLHKIRYIIPVIWTFVPSEYVRIFDFDRGYCDEIMSASVSELRTQNESVNIIYQLEHLNLSNPEQKKQYEQYVNQLSINYLDPQYQVNEEQFDTVIRAERIVRPNEFKKSTRTPAEEFAIAFLRDTMAIANQIAMKTHNLQTKAKDFFLSIPLRIKKGATAFTGNTAYNTKITNSQNTGNFTYFKDGDKVYSLLYPISEDEKANYNTLNDVIGKGTAKRKGIEVTHIFKFTKPDVGDTEEERARTTNQFIRETKEFQRKVLNKMRKNGGYVEGLSIRGNQSNLINSQLKFFVENFDVELSMHYKDVNHPEYANVPIFDPKNFREILDMDKNVFSEEAVEADEALGENKLNLKNVWGAIVDDGGSYANTAFWLYAEKTNLYFQEGYKTKEINHTILPVNYEWEDFTFRPGVNGFCKIILLMWKD